MDREPAVAGLFYPADPDTLRRTVADLLRASAPAAPAVGVVAPHAGYAYSGPVAGETLARVDVPGRAVVLAPNHTGLGARVALWPDGGFVTPLGRVPVDLELTRRIAALPGVELDREAHLGEHALEVLLPFLQARRPDLRVAGLVLGPLSAEEAVALGEGLAAAVREHPALLVASSDMSHYLTAEQAEIVDGRALEPLLALDARGLHRRVRGERITMCGVVPATVMVAAAVALGATRAELVRRSHSGVASGDRSRVVGYAGVVVA